MGLNASAGFNLLNLNNNQFSAQKENLKKSNNSSNQSTLPNDTAGILGMSDNTYNMPSASIYETAGAVAYNYYNTSFSADSSSAETAGTIASTSGGSVSSGSSVSSVGNSSVSSGSSSGGGSSVV